MKFTALKDQNTRWRLFRFALAIYLAASFLHFSFDAAEFVQPNGISPTWSPLSFANALYFFSEPMWFKALMALGGALCLFLFFGYQKWSLVGIWYIWFCIHNKIYFHFLPSEGFVGWILLGLLLFPPEHKNFRERLVPLAWFVFSLAYTYSAVSKLQSPIWQSGFAFKELLYSPEIRFWFNEVWINEIPDLIFRLINWSVMAIELIAIAMIWNKKTRLLWWSMITLLHLGILLFINAPGITVGMLVSQLFLIINFEWQPKNWFAKDP